MCVFKVPPQDTLQSVKTPHTQLFLRKGKVYGSTFEFIKTLCSFQFCGGFVGWGGFEAWGVGSRPSELREPQSSRNRVQDFDMQRMCSPILGVTGEVPEFPVLTPH